jgi:hypothetical protein
VGHLDLGECLDAAGTKDIWQLLKICSNHPQEGLSIMDALNKSKSIPGPAPLPNATDPSEAATISTQQQAEASTLSQWLGKDYSREKTSGVLTQAVSALTQAGRESNASVTRHRTALLAEFERNHPTARHELDLFLALHEVHQSDLEMFLRAAPDISSLSKAARHIFNERQACA